MEVKKEVKYPIKYAVMPIEEQIGWYPGLNELEREYSVVANIVSKCYVIREDKEYLQDGTLKIKYEVVFPFLKKDKIHFGGFEPAIPEYNFYSQCTNSIFINQLFNSFEEAQTVADQENEKILHHTIGILPYNEDFQKNLKAVKEKHQETLDRYKKIEETIEQETCGMKITKTYNFPLEHLIEQIMENPSEFYVKVASKLSPEEREHLKQLIENRCCINCTNGSCRIETCEKVGLDEFGKPQGSSCLSWNNPELIGKQLILKKSNNI